MTHFLCFIGTFEIIFLCFNFASCQISLVPEVVTEEGTVRGFVQTSRDGKTYYSFEGVRFGEKPERFKIAERVKPWEGTREAIEPGEECLQSIVLVGTRGTEDCLFLNVHTPIEHKDEDSKMPVMMFVHGGAFNIGSGSMFGGAYFVDEDVVLVSINYRLGAFGFLYNEDEQIPGNLGIRDQVLALEWIQRNIRHFGGDPNLVTIFGQSAGAACVHILMLSPLAKGLFHRVIAMAGSALSPWAINVGPKYHTRAIAAAVGCPTKNEIEMIDCLRTTDGENLAEVQTDVRWGPIPEYHFAPVVERDLLVNSTNTILSDHPRALMERKEIASNVPLIMGINKNEGALLFAGLILKDEEAVEDVNGNWSHTAHMFLIFANRNYSWEPPMGKAATKVREFYFGDQPLSAETAQRFTDLFSDRFFIHAAVTSAKIQSELSPTYLYFFTFTAGFSFTTMAGIDNFDPPAHGDEVPYLFPVLVKSNLRGEEREFSKKFVKLFTSFARNGEPLDTWGSVKSWPLADSVDNALTWYQLDRDTQLLKDPFYYRVKFWDHLIANELSQYK